MSCDIFNDEIQIDLLELIKHIFNYWKIILVCTLFGGFLAFGISELFLPKNYSSTSDISIFHNTQSIDCSNYIKCSKVLDKVYKSMDVNNIDLFECISVKRDINSINNYHINVTTNNPDLSYKIIKCLLETFEEQMTKELDIEKINIINEPRVNLTPVSPDVKNNVVMSMIISFSMCDIIIVLRFIFNKKIRNAIDAETYLGIDVLAEIPMEKVGDFNEVE